MIISDNKINTKKLTSFIYKQDAQDIKIFPQIYIGGTVCPDGLHTHLHAKEIPGT